MRHLLYAAREAIGFAQGESQDSPSHDRRLTLALLKSIEIVGEAAARVGDATRRRYSQIAWDDIAGMRNRLVHGYFEIDLDLVWATVRNDLPPLVATLARALRLAKD
jgi:uncharacterized protein with HEPN domain